MQRIKKRERPDMMLQTAVPSNKIEETEIEEEELKDRRPYVPALLVNGIPKGMLPNNSPLKTSANQKDSAYEDDSEEEKMESTVKNINYNMLFMLAAGIGLGVLLCYKGYEFVTPALKAATQIVEETVNE